MKTFIKLALFTALVTYGLLELVGQAETLATNVKTQTTQSTSN